MPVIASLFYPHPPLRSASFPQAPVVLSRDHHDVSGTDSPYRETSNVTDGSMFTADMAVQNAIGDSFRGATWVALHNGCACVFFMSLVSISAVGALCCVVDNARVASHAHRVTCLNQ